MNGNITSIVFNWTYLSFEGKHYISSSTDSRVCFCRQASISRAQIFFVTSARHGPGRRPRARGPRSRPPAAVTSHPGQAECRYEQQVAAASPGLVRRENELQARRLGSESRFWAVTAGKSRTVISPRSGTNAAGAAAAGILFWPSGCPGHGHVAALIGRRLASDLNFEKSGKFKYLPL